MNRLIVVERMAREQRRAERAGARVPGDDHRRRPWRVA
jgi:hypothetical protein